MNEESPPMNEEGSGHVCHECYKLIHSINNNDTNDGYIETCIYCGYKFHRSCISYCDSHSCSADICRQCLYTAKITIGITANIIMNVNMKIRIKLQSLFANWCGFDLHQ